MMSVKAMPLLVLVSLASACASAPDGDYPSLAIRDVERNEGTMEPVVPMPQPQAPAQRITDAAGLLMEAKESHQAFESALPAARRIISAGRNAGIGRDAWAAAQVALAGLATHRSRLMIAVADLDRLFVATEVEGQAPGGIADAREGAISLMQEEDDLIAEFSGMLAS